MEEQKTITLLLNRWQGGDQNVMHELMPLIYDQLHEIAWRHQNTNSGDITMRPTAIVNEAFLRLANSHKHIINRKHFFGAAAITIRHILVDFARHKSRAKRGGGRTQLAYDDEKSAVATTTTDVIELNEALHQLESIEPRKVRIIELHYFTGLNYDEIAEVLQISPATVGRELKFTKAWLNKELKK